MTKQKVQVRQPTREEIGQYIADEAAELAVIARRNRMNLLAYLLEMARQSVLQERKRDDTE